MEPLSRAAPDAASTARVYQGSKPLGLGNLQYSNRPPYSPCESPLLAPPAPARALPFCEINWGNWEALVGSLTSLQSSRKDKCSIWLSASHS